MLYRSIFKPLIDFSVAFVALIFAAPIMLAVSAVLFAAHKGQVFFVQKRPGKGGKVFSILKFQTMTNERGIDGQLLPDEVRLTPVGKFVRKTSLDELPQLINVLKGDMSLIGPRPLLVEYLPLYDEEQKHRHDVKPGITGWAQVNGRNAISWEQKFKLDVWYVNNLSFLTDCKVILTTIKKVLFSEDVNSATAATMERFMGSNSLTTKHTEN